jgi:uncharacterized Rmd1/YagE family protein
MMNTIQPNNPSPLNNSSAFKQNQQMQMKIANYTQRNQQQTNYQNAKQSKTITSTYTIPDIESFADMDGFSMEVYYQFLRFKAFAGKNPTELQQFFELLLRCPMRDETKFNAIHDCAKNSDLDAAISFLKQKGNTISAEECEKQIKDLAASGKLKTEKIKDESRLIQTYLSEDDPNVAYNLLRTLLFLTFQSKKAFNDWTGAYMNATGDRSQMLPELLYEAFRI